MKTEPCTCANCGRFSLIPCHLVDDEPWCDECFERALGLSTETPAGHEQDEQVV
jgi:hypothetical protein